MDNQILNTNNVEISLNTNDLKEKVKIELQNIEEFNNCNHLFNVIHYSGRKLGIKLWQCEHCKSVVQAT